MTTHYVLVEVRTEAPADAIDELDKAIAAKIKRALGHHYHNSPRQFRAADVSRWHWETEDADVILYDGPRAVGRAKML